MPPGVIRQRFAEDIKSEIVEHLVPRYFREETQKQNLSPVSQPRVTDLHFHEGEPLKFKAYFEILPDFKVAPYDDIKVETIDTNVSEEDVETALNNLREQHATYSAVEEERPLADGDFAVVSFKGTPKEGEAETPTPSRSKWTRSWSRSAARTRFRSSPRTCAAPRPGEQRTFDVKYADDFSDKRLAGKSHDLRSRREGHQDPQRSRAERRFRQRAERRLQYAGRACATGSAKT